MRTPTSSGQRQVGRRLLATALAFGLLATTGCSTLQSIRALTESSTSTERGEVTETDDATETEEAAEGSTDIDVFSIRVGDCIETSLGDDSGETETLPVIPCNESHEAEIFHAFDIDESGVIGQDVWMEP